MKKNESFQMDVVSVRLVPDTPVLSKHKITTPQEAVDATGGLLCEMDREVVCVINLKTDGMPINCHFVSIGAIDQSILHPRELFKASILSNAASMILLHNHPSGNLHPSKHDTVITDRMLKLTSLMGIPLLDHIIVGGDNKSYFSFKEKGMLNNPCIHYTSDYEMLDFGNQCMVAEMGKERKR